MWIPLIVAAVTGLGSFFAALWGMARRKLVEAPPPSDLLIVAAHPDDCVIMAGEHALRALSAGFAVQVAYVTCGDTEPSTDRARARRAEAIRAWASAGVVESQLRFLDLPESSMGGALRSSERERNLATLTLRELIDSLPVGAAVVVPADGESHIDHDIARDVTLAAWRASQRIDIRLFEAPEYNPFLSLLHAPAKTLVSAWCAIPCAGRLVPAAWRHLGPGFAHGGPGWHLPKQLGFTARKKDMLREFTSEDGDLLVRLFGRPDYLRVLADPTTTHSKQHTGYVKVGAYRLGISAFLLQAFIVSSVASVTAAIAGSLGSILGFPNAFALVGGSVAVVLCAQPKLAVENRLFWIGTMLGFLVALLG